MEMEITPVVLWYGHTIVALLDARNPKIVWGYTRNILTLLLLAATLNAKVVRVEHRVSVAPGCDLKALILKAR